MDTITALTTPPGLGGVAVVRVSGPLVNHIITTLFHRELNPRQATFLPFPDADGQVIDEGIALYFPNPHSFTGEDVLELQGHGGPVVVDLLLQRLLGLGCRLARPGEFSERAFLNGKLDLAQAEAIADLIHASSTQAARAAMRSLQGEFSRQVQALNEKVTNLRIYIEASIDFSDEAIDFLSDARVSTALTQIQTDLADIQSKAKQTSFLREGINVVIVGEPNVGKSTLLNALSGKEVAIVTDIPGTTRDVLRESILIDGMPLHIIDTAGLRESDDVVEQEGIRRAQKEMANADLVLYMSVSHLEFNETHDVNWLYVRNKIDLLNDEPQEMFYGSHHVVTVSAKHQKGLDLLRQAIKKKVGFSGATEGIYLARRRHLDALARAHQHVNAGIHQLSIIETPELAAEELRLTQLALSEITGEFTADDLLGRIFSSFCIGK